MQKKLANYVYSAMQGLDKIRPIKSSRSSFRSKASRKRHSTMSFRELANKVVVIRRALSAWNDTMRHARRRSRGGCARKTQLAKLRHSLILKVILDFRNQLKLLYYSRANREMPQGAMFSWLWKDFKARMTNFNTSYLSHLEESSEHEKRAVKINSAIRTLIDMASIMRDDIAYRTQFKETMNVLSEMKKLIHIQNYLIKAHLNQEEYIQSLDERMKAGEDESLKDDVNIEEEVLHITMDHEMTSRYRRFFMKAQQEQLQFKTSHAELKLVHEINDYNSLYQREKMIFQSIEKAAEQTVNKLEDEVSMMSQKYEYECDDLDLEINRRKNEIMSLLDKQRTMEKKFEETKAEIGDQVAVKVEPASPWTILQKIIEAENARKLAKLEADKLKKAKKSKKGKGGKKGK